MPTRPEILASESAIAAGHPLAATAGFEVLRRGGNAVDAAIAAAGVLAVVQPEMCGVGGDAFLLVHSATAGETLALNGSGAAPMALDPSEPVPEHGPRAVTVPGVVAAWEDALTRFGTRSLAELLQPAIQLAAAGFPLSARVASAIEEHAAWLAERPGTRATYLPDGRPPRPAERLALPALARTLTAIARGGAAAFYRGELAERLVTGVRAQGGVLGLDDLTSHRSEWLSPVRARYRGRDVLVQPPVSQGVVTLGALTLVAGDPSDRLDSATPDGVQLMLEACRLAFADRDAYLGDPRHVDVDLTPFLDPARAARRRALIDPFHVSGPGARATKRDAGGTSHLCVVDREGNAVSLIQSIFGDFGSGVLAGDTGVLLNNRAGGFSADPASPNAIAPGKRPVHTLTNALVFDAEPAGARLSYVLGTPGTDAQVQTLFQLIVALLDRGVGLQDAIELPRWRRETNGSILVESRFDPALLAALDGRGQRLVRGGPWEARTGGAQAIHLDRARAVLRAAADPRREGYAIGW